MTDGIWLSGGVKGLLEVRGVVESTVEMKVQRLCGIPDNKQIKKPKKPIKERHNNTIQYSHVGCYRDGTG